MQRRELLECIALATGCALVGAGRGARAADAPAAPPVFSARDILLLDEIAETILPRTDTPGAKDAGVGAFIARYAAACYAPAELAVLQAGLLALEAEMQARHGVDFLGASDAQRSTALLELERRAHPEPRSGEAPAAGPPPAFTLLQQLTLLGYFTSEPGITVVGRYRPIPGEYHGCVEYHPGEAFWTR